MVLTILQGPLFMEILLPFILVFTVVFAVLQKTKILGEAKAQIDAIVALCVGLITVAFGYATGIIVNLIPFLAVSLIIILVLFVLWGFAFHGEEFKIPKRVTYAFGIIIAIALVAAMLVITGNWHYITDIFLLGGDGSDSLSSIVLVVIAIVAIAAVIGFGGKKDEEKK